MGMFEKRRQAAQEIRNDVAEAVTHVTDSATAAKTAFVVITMVAVVALALAVIAIRRTS